ncbi:MAG: Na-translocating system protein MpsC family protein [Solirubrobacteraceae bacterium]
MHALTSPSREQAPSGASPLLEIANVMVHLYKEAFGRGPSKARAQFSGSDTLVVLMEDMMTIAERQLLALGEHARIREQRLFLQLALEDRKRSEVERVLRRSVIACVSGTDPGRDLAAEVFLLEPHPAVRSVIDQNSDASRVGASNGAADPGHR